MSEPAWVALGSRGGIVDWEGGWSAGVAYVPGDVVRHNGIDYIAVNPSTGQSPVAATPVIGGRELAYAEYATTGVGNTTEAVPNIVVTAPAVVFDGTPVLVEFYSPAVNPHNASGCSIIIGLYQDDVPVGWLANINNPAPSGAVYMQVPVYVARKFSPAAGSHVFKVGAFVNAGTGGVYGGAGGAGQTMPGFLRISKVEPAALNITTYVSDPGYGTTLPASPVNGQEYTLVDSLTAPTYQWRFRYVSGISGANKWVFVGGADLLLRNAGGVLPNGAYGSYGPTFAVPRAGVYNVAWGARMQHPSGLYTYADLYVAGVSVATTSTYETAGYVSNSSSAFRASVGAAAQTLAIHVQGNGTAGAVDQIWMRVTPVAVA